MIDKNEIRLGVWIKYADNPEFTPEYRNKPVQVDEDIMVKLFSEEKEYKFYNPIPLSEEVLVKCGFEKTKRSNIYRCYWGSLDRMIFIGFYENGIYPTLVKEGEMVSDPTGAIMLNKIDYLHELMNFYYFLTKEEIIYTP